MTTGQLLGAAMMAALAFAPWAQAQRMEKDAAWSLRLPKEERVVYRGATSGFTGTAGSFAGPYPAPNVLGFFAAVITHAVVADSAQARARQQAQETADRVLTGYRPVLETFTYKELVAKGLARLSTPGERRVLPATEKLGGGWVLDTAPVFMLTQDEQAILLDNAIAIYGPKDTETPAYQNLVRVVSRPQQREDAMAFWTAGQGAALKEESSTLLALSLDIALADATAPARAEGAPQKTFRYQEGKHERMERAELVSTHCERLVIRSLRGWLISIPTPQATEACKN